MNGMWIETQNGRSRVQADAAMRDGQFCISLGATQNRDFDMVVAKYKTEAARDRAWQMHGTAIASGVRLFRFPTDAELEAAKEEE